MPDNPQLMLVPVHPSITSVSILFLILTLHTLVILLHNLVTCTSQIHTLLLRFFMTVRQVHLREVNIFIRRLFMQIVRIKSCKEFPSSEGNSLHESFIIRFRSLF